MGTDTLPGVTLRDYQQAALQAVDEAEGRGVRRQLIVAATGLGKTIMFVGLAQRRGTRTLILAHRDELITQAVAKVRECWPEANIGVVKADRNEVTAQVVVASVQTLARASRRDILAACPWCAGGSSLVASCTRCEGTGRGWGPADLVVVDEAHHSTADSYVAILAAMHAGDDDGPLLLGVTATPGRGDGQGLDKLFTEVVFTRDMQWGIRNGYLSDLRGLRLRLDMDFSGVHVRRGDYDQGEAGALMTQAGAPEVIAREWLKHAPGRRTLVFTPTVAMAQEVAEAFVAAGVRAGWVSGATPLEERRATLRAYSLGELDVIANCAVLTEGYDEPRTDCIIVARPTKSQALYVQMVGRGTRRHPDKVDCLVLDVVGATEVHSLVTIPSLFGLDAKAVKRMESDGLGAAQALSDQMAAAVLAGRVRAEEAELFAMVRRDGLAWVQVHRDGDPRKVFHLGLGVKRLMLAENQDGTFACSLIRPDPNNPPTGKLRRRLIDGVTMEMALGVGEDYVRTNERDAMKLVDSNAEWRARKPTAKQLAAAAKWRLKVDPSWSAGQLSEALDAHIQRRTGGHRG